MVRVGMGVLSGLGLTAGVAAASGIGLTIGVVVCGGVVVGLLLGLGLTPSDPDWLSVWWALSTGMAIQLITTSLS